MQDKACEFDAELLHALGLPSFGIRKFITINKPIN